MVRCRAKGENYSYDFAASLQNTNEQSILISDSNIRKRFDRLERSCGTYADKRNCAESIF